MAVQKYGFASLSKEEIWSFLKNSSVENLLEEKTNMKKVLLIRSSQLMFTKVAPQLKADDCHVTALVATSINADDIRAIGVDQVISLPHGKGFRFRDLLAYANMMKSLSFDEAICLYNNHDGAGYVNVDLFALLSGAPVVRAISYNNESFSLTARTIMRKCIGSVSGTFWLCVNTVFACLIFFLIFLGMVGVEVVSFFSLNRKNKIR